MKQGKNIYNKGPTWALNGNIAIYDIVWPFEMVIIHYINWRRLWFSFGEMRCIKRGDGKILSVVEADEVTEEQKKSANKLSQQTVKQSNNESDSPLTKESGSN